MVPLVARRPLPRPCGRPLRRVCAVALLRGGGRCSGCDGGRSRPRRLRLVLGAPRPRGHAELCAASGRHGGGRARAPPRAQTPARAPCAAAPVRAKRTSSSSSSSVHIIITVVAAPAAPLAGARGVALAAVAPAIGALRGRGVWVAGRHRAALPPRAHRGGVAARPPVRGGASHTATQRPDPPRATRSAPLPVCVKSAPCAAHRHRRCAALRTRARRRRCCRYWAAHRRRQAHQLRRLRAGYAVEGAREAARVARARHERRSAILDLEAREASRREEEVTSRAAHHAH